MKLKKLFSACCAVLCVVCLCSAPVYADTDGTELQVAEKSVLEIQLGSNWSGVEFQLKTDVGMYPGIIPVGEDGVLRLEIGGSNTYTLSCLNSSVAIPEDNRKSAASEVPVTEAPDEAAVPDTESERLNQEQMVPSKSETPSEPNAASENIIAGIPLKHIILFGGGLVLAVGGLIAIRIVSKHRGEGRRDDYDDEYDEDDE